jgi:hypothetical protein
LGKRPGQASEIVSWMKAGITGLFMDEKEVISILITLSCDSLYITSCHFANLFFLAKHFTKYVKLKNNFFESDVILEVFN